MSRIRFHFLRALIPGLVLIIAACTQTSPSPTSVTPTVKGSAPTVVATSAPTPEPTPFGGTSATLGPVPRNCPAGPTPQSIDGSFSPAVGGSAVWGVGFSGPHATLEWIPADVDSTHEPDGWHHKLLWVVEDSVKGLVTIHGANLSDGTPLAPSAEGEDLASTLTTMVLNSQNPKIINRVDQWVEFPGDLAIPSAGCYYLTATWPGGSWRITFAAGVVSALS